MISPGFPQHCGISPWCGSDRHLFSASAALSKHPSGSFGLSITHSGAILGLGLCEDMGGTPRGCWHLPGHVLDQGAGFLIGPLRPLCAVF